MRQPAQLSPEELIAVVTALQQALYLDFNEQNQLIWNPDKQWDGADICGQLAAELASYELVPQQVIVIQPDDRT